MIKLDLREANSFYEIGFLHGKAVAEKIKECIQKLKTEFGPDSVRVEHLFSEGTEYLQDIRTYLPNVYEEFCGLCDGSEIEQEELLLLNCLDESYLLLKECNRLGKCTSFGVTKEDGSYIIGQNLDFIDMFDGYQMCMIFKSPIDGKEIFQMGYVGQIFGMGINQNGLAVVSTTLLNGAVADGCGVPNTFVQKAILYTKSVDEAVEILKGCPMSTGTSWTIADSEKMLCIETTANRVELYPKERSYIHTNHCIKTSDVMHDDEIFNENGLILHDGISWEMTKERYDFAEEYILNNKSTDVIVKNLLNTPPIHRVDTSVTLWSVVIDCTKSANKVWHKGSEIDKPYELFQFETGDLK